VFGFSCDLSLRYDDLSLWGHDGLHNTRIWVVAGKQPPTVFGCEVSHLSKLLSEAAAVAARLPAARLGAWLSQSRNYNPLGGRIGTERRLGRPRKEIYSVAY